MLIAGLDLEKTLVSVSCTNHDKTKMLMICVLVEIRGFARPPSRVDILDKERFEAHICLHP